MELGAMLLLLHEYNEDNSLVTVLSACQRLLLLLLLLRGCWIKSWYDSRRQSLQLQHMSRHLLSAHSNLCCFDGPAAQATSLCQHKERQHHTEFTGGNSDDPHIPVCAVLFDVCVGD